MSTHKISTAIEINHGGESAYPVFEIAFDFTPGRPAKTYGLPENCYPADPAEVGLFFARVVEDDGPDLTDAEIEKYASDWLSGEGFDTAVEHASEDLLCAFEDAMEQRREFEREVQP